MSLCLVSMKTPHILHSLFVFNQLPMLSHTNVAFHTPYHTQVWELSEHCSIFNVQIVIAFFFIVCILLFFVITIGDTQLCVYLFLKLLQKKALSYIHFQLKLTISYIVTLNYETYSDTCIILSM